MKNNYIAFTALTLVISLNAFAQKNEMPKAAWLLGKWENISSRGSLTEMWEKRNDSTYAGKSFFVISKDTVSAESISLEQRNGHLYYIPTVKNQNGGQPVPFTLTSATTTEMVFENPAHDFPQKITYTLVAKDSLLAVISGTRNGQPRAQRFPMVRAK